MRRNCNLELRLFPPHHDSDHPHQGTVMGGGGSSESEISPQDEGHQQKLTIFYDGKVCVSDVTELQARWILMEASKEKEEKGKRSSSSSGGGGSSPSAQLYSPNTALSMKKSLQLFLQKRKDRIHESSPYHH